MIIKLNSDLSKLTINEILEHRNALLKASILERQSKAWRIKWKELQKLERGLVHRTLFKKVDYDQKPYPWINRCNNSLILAWRDHIYKDIKTESTVLELAGEFSFSQDIFKSQPTVRIGLLAKLQT